MSFFFADAKSKPVDKEQTSAELFQRLECKACPLNKVDTNNPKIKPHGAKNPLIYILNDCPTEEDDTNGEFLSGPEGSMVWDLIPRQYHSQIRVNSIVRDRPKNDNIGFGETECCRPSIVKDIIDSAPKVVLGLGPAVLNWLVGSCAINDWRGRRATLSLGGQPFYYYPVLHPKDIMSYAAKAKYGQDMHEQINEIDYKNIFEEIDNLPPPKVVDVTTIYDGIEIYQGGEDDLEAIIQFFSETQYSGKEIGFDIETKNLRPYKNDSKILSMAFSTGGQSVAFALDHPKAKWTPKQKELLNELIKDFFEHRDNSIVCHNAQYEQEWIAYFYGEDVLRAGKWDDSMAAQYVLDNRYRSEMLKLDTICFRYFGFRLKEQSNINVADLENEPLDKVLKYNALDSKYTVLLHYELQKDILTEGLETVYADQMSFGPTLVLTQMKGIDIDQEFVTKVQKKLEHDIDLLEEKIESGEEARAFLRKTNMKFNTSSPDHLKIMFGDIMKIESIKKTQGGKASFDEEVLKKISHPLAKQILELKGIEKVKSTYIDKLNANDKETYIFPDGKIHTSLSTMFTNTNRVSSNTPNIQNQPRKKNKELVRPAFVAPPGHSFVAFDYGQLEARVIAMCSKDSRFVRALWEDLDVHQDWAERINKRYPKALEHDGGDMKKLRDRVKNKWVFPLFFGAGKKTVAGYMNMPVEVAMPLFDDFWRQFKGVHTWQKEVGKFYAEHGYIEFLNGRRRVGPLPWSEIINSGIQGLAANLVMDAYNRLSIKAIKEGEPWLQPVFMIHDDLSFIIEDSILEDSLDKIITEMVTFKQDFINVPMGVEMSIGTNWYNKEDCGKFFSNTWKK